METPNNMMNKIDVSTQHPTYTKNQPKRDMFAAVRGGTDTLREGGTKYLPKYPAEKPEDYNARLAQVTCDGIVSGGIDSLTGTVFHGDIDTEKVNAKIKPLLENIDNMGTHFNVFARDAFDAAFDGFSVIFVDTPPASDGLVSLGQQNDLGIRPYWRLYRAKDVINWRFDTNPVSNAQELALLVLHEMATEPKERFGMETIDRYRVYEKRDGAVAWELWRKVKDATGGQAEFVLEASGTLALPNIPAAFVGEVEDEPRLLVEARLEVKAYQKESSFDVIEYLSIPTLFTKGYDSDEPLALGASTHIKLPVDGDAGYIQIDAAGHESLKGSIAGIKDYIKSRLNEMTTVTSQSLAQPGQPGTATEAAIEDRDKLARLTLWAEQFKDALEEALEFTAELMGMKREEAGEIVLNTKWAAAQEAQEAMRQAMATGANGNEGGNDTR